MTTWRITPTDGEPFTLRLSPQPGGAWDAEIYGPEMTQEAFEIRRRHLEGTQRLRWTVELADGGLSGPVASRAAALAEFWASVYRRWPGCAVRLMRSDVP